MRISFIIILLITFPIDIFGQHELIIQKNLSTPSSIESYFLLYEDTFQNKKIHQIASSSFSNRFKKFEDVNKTRKPNSIYWGKLVVKNEEATFTNYYISLNAINYVTLYQKEESGNFSEKYTGELQKSSLKDVKGTRKECIFELVLLPNQKKTLFFKIESVTGFKPKLSPKLIKPKTWEANNKLIFIQQSFFQGVLWVMIILSFLIFLGNRDRAYLYYGLYVSCIAIYFLWNTGFLTNYIFPEWPLFNLYLWTAFPISPFFYFLFFRKFIGTKAYLKEWDPIIKKVAFLSIFIVVAAIVLQTIFLHTFYLIIISNIILICQLVFGVYILFLIPKSAQLFTFAFLGSTGLALTAIFSIVMYFLGNTNFASYGQLGTLLELIIFAIGLGYKVKLNEENKRQAQTDLIYQLEENKKLQENINRNLERQVALRTHEISEKNEELETQNVKIEIQRDEILNKSRKLEQFNAEIQMMNQHLEELVAIRTKELINSKSELDLFLYRTSHDLRGPLARMEGLLQLAKLEENDPNVELLNCFDDVINEMGTTLEKLLALSIVNKSPDENKDIFVKNISTSINQIFKRQSNCITYDYDEGLCFNSKPNLIKLVLRTLIENAFIFYHKSPKIIISFRFKNENKFIINVSDNGDGIRSKDLNKIFDMFFIGSNKSEGNGLGLFIVKKAVEALNGTIEVESQLEKGTTFIITIPQQVESELIEKLDLAE